MLLENNHRKIAVICSAKKEYTGYERYKGYMGAMEHAGITVPEEYVKSGRLSIERGYQCPDDISLLEFDGLILSQVVQPKMYMVVQPVKEMGKRAVGLLLNRIKYNNQKDAFLVKAGIVPAVKGIITG